jgi:hypothetical protein
MPGLVIEYRLSSGEERSEDWPSVERFRAWAQAEGLRCTWTAYRPDDEGELVVEDKGRI